MITDADGEYRLAAAVCGPIIPDVLAFRVAGGMARGDGLIENSFTGSDYAKSHSVLRTKLLFTPWGPDGLRIVASYLYDRHFGNDGRGYTFTDLPNSWKRRTVDANRETYSKTSTDLFTFDISCRWATSSPCRRSARIITSRPSRPTTAICAGTTKPMATIRPTRRFSVRELRLTFDTGPLQGLVGAYYSKHEIDYLANSTFSLDLDENLGLTSRVADFLVQNAGFDPATALGTAQAVRGVYPQRVFISSVQLYPFNIEMQALFGDASWEVAPGLKLLAGFRYDREKQIVRNENAVTLNTVLPNPADYAANPTLPSSCRR
jgi:outer membrane receptor protein involved in Fe transport